MRKWNAALSAAILVLFLAHAIAGGFQLLGAGSTALKTLARIMVALIAAHAVIGVILTARTIRAQSRSGAAYWRANSLFWARRVSGLALLLLLAAHMTAFGTANASGAYRLRLFAGPQLALHLVFAAALAVHILANVRPLLIGLGVRSLKEHAGEILFVLAALLLFAAAAFIVYYLRWAAL